MLYSTAFVILLVLLAVFKLFTYSKDESEKAQLSSDFIAFKRGYLIVYVLVMGADWLQGPYVYALYQHYGFDQGEIAQLFLIGFATSMIFGVVVGSAADRYGRKKMCLMYAVFYGASCITKHFGDFYALALGRFLGGLGTSILFSSFEAWMVDEHHNRGHPDEWMPQTFSTAQSINGAVAIIAGVIASFAVDTFGKVAPFDVSLVLLVFSAIYITANWTENYGNKKIDMKETVTHAWKALFSDSKVALLGLIQSFFEGPMFIFVFMWTPALERTALGEELNHGWIFACFMVAVVMGSTLFGYLLEKGYQIESFTCYMFLVAAGALAVPAFSDNHLVILTAFVVFEVCVGMFWPSLGTMRGRYVPEDVRATVMNFFRVLLNLIVVIVMVKMNDITERNIFLLSTALLLLASLCQFRLKEIVQRATRDAVAS